LKDQETSRDEFIYKYIASRDVIMSIYASELRAPVIIESQ